jgi:diguanylate cyclase
VMVFRTAGVARAWRALLVAAMTCWLIAQSLWWWHSLVLHAGPPTPRLAAVAHFAFLAFALAALLLLALSGRSAAGGHRSTPHTIAVLVLDGLVTAVSFGILVWSAGTGPAGSLHLPRSGGRPETLAYPFAALFVVVVAVVIAIGYRVQHRFRLNYLLLAGGVTTVLASDRLVAYLTSVGSDAGKMWARVGFILGPLLIAFAVLRLRSIAEDADGPGVKVMAWSQLLLPYVGATGVSVLLAFHVYIGGRLDLVQVGLSVVIVFLLVARQIVSLRENRRLLHTVLSGQRRLLHQVHHDALTGLPNRLLFAERLNDALSCDEQFILMYVDLDDFKDVNDEYGHASGDRLLRAVGHRLLGCARTGDTVARIGGDEFGILVRGDVGPPESFADRYRAALRPPFALHGRSVRVRASMGVVTPDSAAPQATADEFLRRADVSMYEGKRQGKDSVVLYRHSASATVDFPAALRAARGAVPRGFHIVYQPIVTLPEGAPVALEALARWTAPNGTLIPPETFVAAAEAAGLGAQFDALVLDTVCAEIVSAGIDLAVHVNVGAARLGRGGFETVVADTLARHGIAPGQVTLEITESMPIVDLADGAAAVRRLQALGVTVALDDFGAGYCSLTYLHALPVDLVKLDRSLTIGIGPGEDATLYRSVIRLCADLGVGVVAEGLETQAQADMIASVGGLLGQGYRFGRPVPVSALTVGAAPTGLVDAGRIGS